MMSTEFEREFARNKRAREMRESLEAAQKGTTTRRRVDITNATFPVEESKSEQEPQLRMSGEQNNSNAFIAASLGGRHGSRRPKNTLDQHKPIDEIQGAYLVESYDYTYSSDSGWSGGG